MRRFHMGMPRDTQLLGLSPGVSAADRSSDVTYKDDSKEDATVIRLSAVSNDMQLSTLAPIFDDLGLKVLSYSLGTSTDSCLAGSQHGCGSATIVTAGNMQQLTAAKKELLALDLRRTLSGSSSLDAQPQDEHNPTDQKERSQGQGKQFKHQQDGGGPSATECARVVKDGSDQPAPITVNCMAGWNVSSGSSTATAEDVQLLQQHPGHAAAAAAVERGANTATSNLSRLAVLRESGDGLAPSTSLPSGTQSSRPLQASPNRRPRSSVKRGQSRVFLSPLGQDSTEQRLFVSIPKGRSVLPAGLSPSAVASPPLSARGFSISRRPDSFSFPAISMFGSPASVLGAASTPIAATSNLAQVSSGTPQVHDAIEARPEGGDALGHAMVSFADEDEMSDDEEWWCGTPCGALVEQLMSTPVRSVHADAPASEAKALMARHNISALLVDAGDGGEPGFVTKRDLLRASFAKRGPKRTRRVRDAMQQPVLSVELGTPIEACAQMLQEWGIRRALVRDAAKADHADPIAQFVGVVSDAAIFKYLGLYSGPVSGEAVSPGSKVETLEGQLQRHGTEDSIATSCAGTEDTDMHVSSGAATPTRCGPAGVLTASGSTPLPAAALQRSGSNLSSGSAGGAAAGRSPLLTLPGMLAGRQGETHFSTASTASEASLLAHVPAFGRSASGVSLAALSEGAEGCALNRYKCAAALWELDFGEIEILRKIGEGSFGEVLLGDLRGTKVAVKRLRLPGGEHSNPAGHAAAFDQLFEREISILASIRHPCILTYIGACHTPPNCCLVTEYCARGSLDALLHKSGLHLDLVKRTEFAMDVARGMTALHSARPNAIIHRDLKPANLLVTARFEIKVADFGLSRIKDASQLQNSRAGLEGTIEYCAPEVLRGEPFTEKCDVWSFGVVLWELLTRRRPYSDADVPIYLLMVNIANGTLQLPCVEPGLATPGLLRLLDQCLQQEACARPEFLEVLHALEAEHRGMRRAHSSESAGSVRVMPSGSHDHSSHQEHPSAAWPAAPHQGSPPAAVLQRVLRWSDAQGQELGHHTAAEGAAHAAGAASCMPQQRLPVQHASQVSAAAPEGTSPAVQDGEHLLHAATTPFAAAAGAALAAIGGAAPIPRPLRQRRMSRARSMPMPAFESWVEDDDMMPVRESERLQPSNCSSADSGADVAAAVATLHVTEQQQSCDRYQLQQQQQQQGVQDMHRCQQPRDMVAAVPSSSTTASPFMMTGHATPPWSPFSAVAGANSHQPPGSSASCSHNSSQGSSVELQALHPQPADASSGSTACVLPPCELHVEGPQRPHAASPQQHVQQHTPQPPLHHRDSSSSSSGCLRSVAAASTPPHWPGQHRHVSSRLSIQGSYELPPPSAPLSDGAVSATATPLPAPALSASVLRKEGSQRSMSSLARAAQAAAAAAAARGVPRAPAAYSPFAAAAAAYAHTEEQGEQQQPYVHDGVAQSPPAVPADALCAADGMNGATGQLPSALKPAPSPFALMQPAWD